MLWMEGALNYILSKIENSYFLHMWNSVLCRANITLDNRSPKGSFFEYLLGDNFNSEKIGYKLKENILFDIRRYLDIDPNFKKLYEEKMGLDWNKIYPDPPRGFRRIYSLKRRAQYKAKQILHRVKGTGG